jgi:hypothetical protein
LPAAFGAAGKFCSYRRINLPLLKITFCFHTASARNGSTATNKNGDPQNKGRRCLFPIKPLSMFWLSLEKHQVLYSAFNNFGTV